MGQIKVAFLYPSRKGGGDLYALHMARILAKENSIQTHLFLSANMHHLNEFTLPNVPRTTVRTIGSYLDLLTLPFSILSLILKIRSFRPDIIYAPMFSPFILPVFLFTGSVRKICTVHGYYSRKSFKEHIISYIQTAIVRLSTEIIVLSKYYEQEILKNSPSKKVHLIPHPNLDYYKSIKPSEPPFEKDYILFIGRISEEYKGGEVMLQAFKLTKQKLPSLKLVIAGRGASKYAEEGVIAHDKWLEDADFAALIKSAKVICVPYTMPTPSGVVSAAFSLSKPVIASNIPGLNEQVEDSVTGLLFQPNNPVELSEKILELYSDEKLYSKLVSSCSKSNINAEVEKKFINIFLGQ
ncbi:glycosyltransferase family 4 protein [Candidatus Micrarchaeota archaeon]|nr:glycosyltransferase family 4 protein [Candidatus Micrarchaeota archaeon]